MSRSSKLVLAALFLLATLAAGCLPMMIGSLGYEGYEYEKTGKLPGMPSQNSSVSQPKARSTPSDAIE